MRENLTHGSIGGRWAKAEANGETEHAPEAKPPGLSLPTYSPAKPVAYLTVRYRHSALASTRHEREALA